jgi:hypothetical protein
MLPGFLSAFFGGVLYCTIEVPKCQQLYGIFFDFFKCIKMGANSGKIKEILLFPIGLFFLQPLKNHWVAPLSI